MKISWNSELVVGIVTATITAVSGGIYALRSKIQAKAWETVYTQKRNEILSFLQLLNRFAQLVLVLGEIRDTEGGSFAQQGNALHHWADQLWPAQSRDPFATYLLNKIPKPERLADVHKQPSPAEEAVLTQIRIGFYNLIIPEIIRIAYALSNLQSTLIVSVRNPNVVIYAHSVFGEYFTQLTSGRGIAGFDFDNFAEAWAKKTSPARLALRRDLRKSSKSLAAAHRISWVWWIANVVRNPARAVKTRWTVYLKKPDFSANGNSITDPSK